MPFCNGPSVRTNIRRLLNLYPKVRLRLNRISNETYMVNTQVLCYKLVQTLDNMHVFFLIFSMVKLRQSTENICVSLSVCLSVFLYVSTYAQTDRHTVYSSVCVRVSLCCCQFPSISLYLILSLHLHNSFHQN